MADERKKHGWAVAAVLAIGLMVVYPVSIGPAALAFKLAGDPAHVEKAADIFYWPLTLLPDPVVGFIDWWVGFWRNLAP